MYTMMQNKMKIIKNKCILQKRGSDTKGYSIHTYLCMEWLIFSATTHTDLVLRAREKGLQYRVIHNASIMNAVGCCGLQVIQLSV